MLRRTKALLLSGGLCAWLALVLGCGAIGAMDNSGEYQPESCCATATDSCAASSCPPGCLAICAVQPTDDSAVVSIMTANAVFGRRHYAAASWRSAPPVPPPRQVSAEILSVLATMPVG